MPQMPLKNTQMSITALQNSLNKKRTKFITPHSTFMARGLMAQMPYRRVNGKLKVVMQSKIFNAHILLLFWGVRRWCRGWCRGWCRRGWCPGCVPLVPAGAATPLTSTRRQRSESSPVMAPHFMPLLKPPFGPPLVPPLVPPLLPLPLLRMQNPTSLAIWELNI